MVLTKLAKWLNLTVFGHSAAIHTADEELTKEFGKAVKKPFVLSVTLLRLSVVSRCLQCLLAIIDTWMWFLRTQLCWGQR